MPRFEVRVALVDAEGDTGVSTPELARFFVNTELGTGLDPTPLALAFCAQAQNMPVSEVVGVSSVDNPYISRAPSHTPRIGPASVASGIEPVLRHEYRRTWAQDAIDNLPSELRQRQVNTVLEQYRDGVLTQETTVDLLGIGAVEQYETNRALLDLHVEGQQFDQQIRHALGVQGTTPGPSPTGVQNDIQYLRDRLSGNAQRRPLTLEGVRFILNLLDQGNMTRAAAEHLLGAIRSNPPEPCPDPTPEPPRVSRYERDPVI